MQQDLGILGQAHLLDLGHELAVDLHGGEDLPGQADEPFDRGTPTKTHSGWVRTSISTAAALF